MSTPNWYLVILSWLADVAMAKQAVVIGEMEAKFILRLAGAGHKMPNGMVAERLRVRQARSSWVPYCRAVLNDVESVARGERTDLSLTRDSALALVALACDPSLYQQVLDADQ